MASASTPSATELDKDLILVHKVQLKAMVKAHISGRMVYSGINDVAIASVHSEKTCLKKLIIIMKNRKKRRFFSCARNLLPKARKVMVDFKFEAQYR